jgi:hypothetical protein
MATLNEVEAVGTQLEMVKQNYRNLRGGQRGRKDGRADRPAKLRLLDERAARDGCQVGGFVSERWFAGERPVVVGVTVVSAVVFVAAVFGPHIF